MTLHILKKAIAVPLRAVDTRFMPELPDVEAARKQVEKAAKKKKITEVIAHSDKRIFDQVSSKEFVKDLEGATITGTDRRGKYFWLRLNRKPWPIFHFGMTGSFEIYKKGKAPTKLPKSLRVRIFLNDGTELWFKDPRRFGRVRVENNPLRDGAVSRLGYDPLIQFPTAKELHEILSKRKAPIKATLLDQSIFAGVGNWIADEVLYQARLSPFRAARSLTEKETATLRSAILKVIKKAVAVNAEAERFPKSWLFHHRWERARKTVKSHAGHPIQYSTIGGRTSAWVPDLQK